MKYLLVIFILLFSLQLKAQNRNTSEKSLIDLIIDFGETYKGVKYKYGSCSASNNGFDCSGFMYYIFKMAGLEIPRSSMEISKKGKKIDLIHLQKGDFVFFNTLNSGKVSHIGIVSEANENDIIMLHVSSSKGVQEVNIISSDYWYARFVFGKRIY